MEQTLDALQGVGVLHSWVRRPLGIYYLQLSDGHVLTPSTKETALWVMGASSAMLHVGGQVRSADDDLDRVQVSDTLDTLVRLGVLKAWELDRDGDYELRLQHDNWLMPSNQINAFLGGALAAVKSQDRRERPF